MAHKVFISFKKEDEAFKVYIQNKLDIEMIDKSLDSPINSNNEDYIMRKIREDYLADSTVTIFLIGKYSSEYAGPTEQRYIKRELQASLYNGEGNTRNGILGVVLPNMTDLIYKGTYICNICGKNHDAIGINDSTVIREFSRNYYIQPLATGKCAWAEEDRYCVLVKWNDFVKDPERYIDQAFDKRFEPIADRVTVYPK